LQGLGNLAIVDESYFLYERDEKGELKPISFEIEKGKEVLITPIPDGELADLRDPEKSYILFSRHLISPKISPETLKKAGKTTVISKTLTKMLEVSGIEQPNKDEASGRTNSP